MAVTTTSSAPPSPYVARIEQCAREEYEARRNPTDVDTTRDLSEEDAETDRRLRGIHYYQFNNEPTQVLTWDDIPYMLNNLVRSGLVREIELVKVEIDGFEVELHVGSGGYGDPLVTLRRAPEDWFGTDQAPPPLTEEWIRKFCGVMMRKGHALSESFKLSVFVSTLKPDGITAFLECPLLSSLILQRGMVETGGHDHHHSSAATYTPAFHRLVQTHVSLKQLGRGWSRNWQASNEDCGKLMNSLHTRKARALVALVSAKKDSETRDEISGP